MVFQSYALYPHLKVGENIGYPLRVRKIAKGAIQQGVDRVAERSRSTTSWTASPATCPAASGSGSRWPGPSSGAAPRS